MAHIRAPVFCGDAANDVRLCVNGFVALALGNVDDVQHRIAAAKHRAAIAQCWRAVHIIFRFVFPNLFAGLRIEAIKKKIVAADDDVGLLAIGTFGPIRSTGDLVARFIFPNLLTGLCVQRKKHSEAVTEKNSPIQKQGWRFNGFFCIKLPKLFAIGQIQRIKFPVISAKINTPIAYHDRSSHWFIGIKFP